MNTIEELFSDPSVLEVIANLKDKEPVKIEGQPYVVETIQIDRIKGVFFCPVVDKELWKESVFGVVFYKDKAMFLKVFESDTIRKFLNFLRKEGENGKNEEKV